MSKKIIPSADTYFNRPGNTLTAEAWEVFKANNPRSEYTCETCWHAHDSMLTRNKPLSDASVTKKVLIKAGIYFTGEFDRIRITSDLRGKVILVVDYEDDNLLLQLEGAGAKVVYITSNPNYDKNTPDLYFTMYPENYMANDYPAEDKRNLFNNKNIRICYINFFNYLQTLDTLLKELRPMEFDLIISNPPYGKIGANITKDIVNYVKFKEFINLEPGNDYFINNDYKYIDSKDTPIVLKNGAFEDANQATTIARINKEENDLSEIEARTLLSIRNDDKQVYTAISELLVKINSVKTLSFTRRSVPYSDDWFVFNSGGFEIHGGALQLKNRKGDDWSASTKYNLQKVAASSVSGFPSSVVKGCTSFKKLIYSEDGLRLIHLLFGSSPEGWGLNNGMFADIDYSQFKSWKEVFSYLNVSQVSQDIIYNALNKIELNKAELDVIELANDL